MRGEFARRVTARGERGGISFSNDQLQLLENYYELLARWNRTINLTALPLLDFPDRTLDRLLIEPVLGAGYFPAGPVTWFDLGSGSGSPAVPLKVVRPEARLTMVESRERKAAFLREVVRTLVLRDVSVLTVRIEGLSESISPGSADVVTARAVRPTQGLLATVKTLLSPGGRFLFYGSVNESPTKSPQPFRVEAIVPLTDPTDQLYVLA